MTNPAGGCANSHSQNWSFWQLFLHQLWGVSLYPTLNAGVLWGCSLSFLLIAPPSLGDHISAILLPSVCRCLFFKLRLPSELQNFIGLHLNVQQTSHLSTSQVLASFLPHIKCRDWSSCSPSYPSLNLRLVLDSPSPSLPHS